MKALKRILLAVSVLILLCIGGVFLVESYIEKQLKKEEQLSFGEFKMNFLGNVSLREVNFKNQKVEVSIEDVALDIGLINLIFSDTIIVKSSKAKGVRVNYYKLSSDSDRKSTRLNSSHVRISYAVFCLKKKNHTVLPQILTILTTIHPS